MLNLARAHLWLGVVMGSPGTGTATNFSWTGDGGEEGKRPHLCGVSSVPVSSGRMPARGVEGEGWRWGPTVLKNCQESAISAQLHTGERSTKQ